LELSINKLNFKVMFGPIEWGIDPQIFDGLPFRYYSILFVTGLALGYWVVKRIYEREKLSVEDLDRLAFYIFIGTVVGARLGHCLFYEPDYYLSRPWEMILPIKIEDSGVRFTGFLGLASHGGILGVFIAIWLYCRKTKTKIFSVLDKVAIGGSLTAVFIRLGNFMNSEILGKATGGDYGVIFTRVDQIPRHPAQLYESFAYLLIFIALSLYYRKRGKDYQDGFVFGLFFSLLFIARFTIEFFKENQVAFEDNLSFNMGQLLSIPFIIAGFTVMWWKRKGGKAK